MSPVVETGDDHQAGYQSSGANTGNNDSTLKTAKAQRSFRDQSIECSAVFLHTSWVTAVGSTAWAPLVRSNYREKRLDSIGASDPNVEGNWDQSPSTICAGFLSAAWGL